MKLSKDEQRALAFVAFLLVLAAGVRAVQRPDAAFSDLAELDLGAFEEAARAELAAVERRRRPLEPGERIDPNTADGDELQRLPGIGPAVAARILEDRAARGAYRSLQDLERVPGLGPRTLERLAPHLTFGSGSPWAAGSGPALPPTTPATRARPPPANAATADASGLVDINTATAAELEALPGIGPVIARRIVAFRDSAGPFRSPSELERVPGIGPATLNRILPRLRLSP